MDYARRLGRLRRLLGELSCEAFLVENPIDLFYLTGLSLSTGKLLVAQREAFLVVDGRYAERSGQQKLYPVRLFTEEILGELIRELQIHQLSFDGEVAAYREFSALTRLAAKLQGEGYALEISSVESVVPRLRLIKDDEEIARLREAAHLGCQGYEFVVSLLREGVTESALALELEFFWKKRGASRLAFAPIIAFGSNSSMPHHHAGSTPLALHSTVLIDIGVVLAHYHSDMTRVLFFGSPPPVMEAVYGIVEEAKAKALALCRPGTLVGELDRAAREWIVQKGHGDRFPHGLGHGVGLEIHEIPYLREKGAYRDLPLEPGMVITIEPGIYLPGVGGVRLEDTVLITPTGYENLTVSAATVVRVHRGGGG